MSDVLMDDGFNTILVSRLELGCGRPRHRHNLTCVSRKKAGEMLREWHESRLGYAWEKAGFEPWEKTVVRLMAGKRVKRLPPGDVNV